MINKLVEKIKKTGAPIVVGLDPMLGYIPQHIQEKAFAEFGETLEGAAEAIWQFNKEIVDKTYDLIPAVKPQIAMYEQFGVPGVMAFKKTVDYCKSKDLVVIGDIKRGDIGSTSAAYAVGHLGRVQVGSKAYVPFDEDFATVNPYLGSDGVDPFIKVCKEEKKGIFVLVKTSNPASGELQDKKYENGKTLYDSMADLVDGWGAELIGKYGYSSVGAVVGATHRAQAEDGAEGYYSSRYEAAYLTWEKGGKQAVVWYLDSRAMEVREQLLRLFGVGQVCFQNVTERTTQLPEL